MKYFSQEGLILLFVIAELFPCFLGPGLKRHQKGLIFEEHFYRTRVRSLAMLVTH